MMFHTFEALLNADGTLRFLEPVQLAGTQRVLVTFIPPASDAANSPSLATDWLRPDEDAAWAHLQPVSVAQ